MHHRVEFVSEMQFITKSVTADVY